MNEKLALGNVDHDVVDIASREKKRTARHDLVLSSVIFIENEKREQSLLSKDLNLLSKNEGEIRISDLNSENQRLGSEFSTWEIEVKTKLNHKRNDIEEL